jgi:hypothetical protein
MTVIALLVISSTGPGLAEASVVYLKDGTLLTANSPAPDGSLPVLFVHGHKPGFSSDPDPNYKINWQKMFSGLPSFKNALELSQNEPLDIEPYYIHFEDQHRSIVQDASDIADAVERILAHHDPNHVLGTANPATHVKVAIIAYSKGTISGRLYLKSLHEQQYDLPAPRAGFNPISEFVAISPPNHGLNLEDLYTATSTSLRQLNNGYKQDCSSFVLTFPEILDFIENLNGHPIEDTMTAPFGNFDSEAPGSRPNGSGVTSGTLYVTIFADQGRDFVGGSAPSNDCSGRVAAANLAPDSWNIELSEIAPGQTDTSLMQSPVHQTSVHTPEVICLALYTIVHHHAPAEVPEEDGPNPICRTENGVPVVPPPVALVHVLDVSGSMLGEACADCNPKLQVLKEAVQIFLDLWTLSAGPADQIGVQLFGTQVTPLILNSPPLMPVTEDNVSDVILEVDALDTAPNNLTAMGGGLQRAIELLQVVGGVDIPNRHVVLFTDGMQNVNPMVIKNEEDSPSHYEIVNQPGHPVSNVSANEPPINLKDLGEIKVHTIGVGATEPFMNLLTEIAEETEGTHELTLNPDQDLRQHYIQVLIESLRGHSPQLVGYRRGTLTGERQDEHFTIGRGGRRVLFKLSWNKDQKLSFVVRKDGVDLTSAGKIVDRGFYRLFALDLPAQIKGRTIDSEGDWQMVVTGPQNGKYEAAAIVDSSRLEYALRLKNLRLRAGEPLHFKVKLSREGRALSGEARIQATVSRRGDSLANLLAQAEMAVDKSSAAVEGGSAVGTRLQNLLEREDTSRRLSAEVNTVTLQNLGDGIYGGEFTATEVPGPYRVTVEIEGEDPHLGTYHREATATVLVLAGLPDVDMSVIRVTQTTVQQGMRTVDVSVTPRDGLGNFLGPDYGDRFRVVVGGQSSLQPVKDGLDGSYLMRLVASEEEDPKVSISVQDVPLFEGPFSGLAQLAEKRQIVLWLLLLFLLLVVIAWFIFRIRSR